MEKETIYKELERKISLADLQAQYDLEAIYLLSEKINPPDGNREYQLLVNVEAQKAEPSDYDIPERGAFYTATMISAQYGPVFTGKDYSKLKKVYSIWIVMNCSESNGNTIMRYYTEKETVLGKEPKRERYNFSEVIVIRLTKNLAPKGKTELKLHRFLGTIFSDKLEVDEKKAILKNEFNLPMGSEMRRKVTTVCNLSEAIVEDAMNRGEKNKLRELIQRKIEKGKPLEVIADELEETVENIRELYEELLKEK